MILGVLSVVFFEFEAHLLFIHHFALQLLAQFLLGVQILLQNLLVVGLLLRLNLVLLVQLLQLGLVLLRDLTDKHAVVSPLAILEKDGEDLPDVGNNRILRLCVLEAVLDQFVESDGVNVE